MAEDKLHEEEMLNEEQASEQSKNSESTDNKETETSPETERELTPEEKYAELNDRFLRLYAEFDNYRRRSQKEKLEYIASANGNLLKDLLPILDDFERAVANNEKVEDIAVVKEGFHLIDNKFRSILESKGVKAMEAKGSTFDSELHEAIANIPAPEESLKGKIIDDVEKGYFLNDKVIRYAKVVVGQ